MYQPPTWERMEPVFIEILDFLQSCGGPYTEIKPYVQEHVLSCLALGQFYYSKNRYFVGWWMITEEGLAELKEQIRPTELKNGTIMNVMECAAKEGMSEIRRKLRRHGRQGVHWHRAGKGWQDYPTQKGGADNGK